MAWQRAASILELFQHRVILDTSCNDDAGGKSKALARQVNRLDWLGAFELVYQQRMAIDTAQSRDKVQEKCTMSQGL